MKANYKDLAVWRESMALVVDVYALVKKFPTREGSGLAEQVRRSAVAIPSQIAEGEGRAYRLDFLEYLENARGELAGLHTLLLIAEQLGYLSQAELEMLEKGLEGVSKPLQGLITKVRKDAEAA